MKYYTLAKQISQTYGHGNYGQEFHICPIDAYHTNSVEFHPIFETTEQAQEYIDSLEGFEKFTIVELNVNV